MSLHECTRLGLVPEVTRLLRDGMQPNKWGHTGMAPLHIASKEGFVMLIDLLMSAKPTKADVDRRTGDRKQETALHIAIIDNDEDAIPVTRSLLKHKANVNLACADGWSSLHKVAQTGNYEVAQLLLGAGAAVNSTDNDGATPLHYSLAQSHVQLVKLLLHHDADHHARDHVLGGSSLQRAVRAKSPELVEMLLRHCRTITDTGEHRGITDSNAPDHAGWTALHHAAANGCSEIVQLLLLSGGEFEAMTFPKEDAGSMDRGGVTPLDLSTSRSHDHVSDILRQWEYFLIDQDGDGELTTEELVAFVRKTEGLDNEVEKRKSYIKEKPKVRRLPGDITTPETILDYKCVLDQIVFLGKPVMQNRWQAAGGVMNITSLQACSANMISNVNLDDPLICSGDLQNLSPEIGSAAMRAAREATQRMKQAF